jgi:hypothetical protein
MASQPRAARPSAIVRWCDLFRSLDEVMPLNLQKENVLVTLKQRV